MRMCPVCGKRVWFWQRDGIDATSGDELVAHHDCLRLKIILYEGLADIMEGEDVWW
jgi:hypothetical protein